jgi:hypothetical protein
MPLSAAVGRRYKHVGNASLDDERESKATFSLRFNTQELSSGTYSIRCLLPKDYFETSTSSKETSSADQTEDRDAMKKKKEVHKALLVASKKEVQGAHSADVGVREERRARREVSVEREVASSRRCTRAC